MFTKLLKHEFRAVRKSLWPLSIAALLSSVVGYIIMLIATSNIEIEDNAILESLATVLQGGIYVFLVVYAIGSSISLYVRFYRTKFTDEGYLTFTLPASTHQILLSSILNMVIWFAIVAVVLAVCIVLLISPLVVELNNELDFSNLFSYIEAPPIGVIFVSTLQFICSMCYGLILPLLAITIGSLFAKKHKLLAAFGVGYGINMAVSFVSSLLTILELTSSDMLYEEYYISISSVITSVLSLILAVVGYFVMHHLIKNKLNI